jgi:preprotein translocase subunit SecF
VRKERRINDAMKIQYIIQYSIAKTIARKYNVSMKQVFAKYGNNLTTIYINTKGITKTISLALYTSFRRNRVFFKN